MKLRTLTFDTETLSLVKDWRQPIHTMNDAQLAQEPFTVQLAFIIHEIDTDTAEALELYAFKTYIKPSTDYMSFNAQMFIDNPAVDINKITWDMCNGSSYDMKQALQHMKSAIDKYKAQILLAHNAQFDVRVLQGELLRCGLQDWLINKHIICTKILFKGFADAAGVRATLESAYKYFNAGNMFEDAHDAFADVKACHNVFMGCCKKLNMWPQPYSVLSVAAYSNGYHDKIPSSIWDTIAWRHVAEIDLVQGPIVNLDNNKALHKEVKLHIKQDYYDERSLREYNVDIDACKHGFNIKTALHLLNVYVQFSQFIVMHNVTFHLGLINAQYIRNKPTAADNYVSGVTNAILQKPYVIDCNILGCILIPSACIRPNYVRRDDIYEHFTGKLPTVDISAALSIYYNFTSLCTCDIDETSFKQSFILTSSL